MDLDKKRERSWVSPDTVWNTMFFSIFFTNMALNLVQQMSNSLLSLYAKTMGASAGQIGQLMSMLALSALLFRFISGPAMNSFSRKSLLGIAMGFMSLAYLGFGLAQSLAVFWGIQSIQVLRFFRLAQGVGHAFGNSCCLAIVADALPRDKFTTGMGYYACAHSTAQSLGPAVGILMRNAFGYQMTYFFNFGLMLVSILLVSRVKLPPRERIPFKLSFNTIIAKEVIVPVTILFFIHTGFASINAFLLVYSEERGISGGSLFFTVYALTLLITRPVIGRLTHRFGFVKVAIPAVMLTISSLTLIGFARSLTLLLIAALLNACGYGALQPMLQSLSLMAVKPERRGSASSTNYIGMDIAMLLGPSACGLVAQLVGYTPTMWLVMTIPIFVGLASIIFFRKRIRGNEEGFLCN